MKDVGLCLDSFFFLACGCLVFPAPCFEETIFAPFYYLCSFIKDQLTIFMWVNSWALYYVPLIYSLFSHCLNYCSFIVSLEVA